MESLKSQIEDHIKILNSNKDNIINNIIKISHEINECFNRKNKILIFGNGGSAADAQHIAAEFTGRFVKERRGLPCIALTTDTSALTAIGNDYGYEKVFSRQVDALANKGDIVFGISTSGNSENVINALQMAKEKECFSISFTGNNGGNISEISDLNVNINSNVTARIQELHILCGHLICSIIDQNFD